MGHMITMMYFLVTGSFTRYYLLLFYISTLPLEVGNDSHYDAHRIEKQGDHDVQQGVLVILVQVRVRNARAVVTFGTGSDTDACWDGQDRRHVTLTRRSQRGFTIAQLSRSSPASRFWDRPVTERHDVSVVTVKCVPCCRFGTHLPSRVRMTPSRFTLSWLDFLKERDRNRI